MDFRRTQSQVRTAAVLLIALVAMISGCASKPVLNLETTAGKRYVQAFKQGYLRQSDAGDYEVLLIDDGLVEPKGNSGPVLAAKVAPLRQVVYVRVLWRPERGTKPDQPTATNAVVDWYVSPNDADRQSEYLHYQGSAFCSIYNQDHPRVWIYNATLALHDQKGDMTDPLGKTTFEGWFPVQRNDAFVQSAVQQFRTEMSSTASAR